MPVVETPPTTYAVELDPTVYLTSDGKPLAENTEPFRWIVTIKETLEALFAADANVFVAEAAEARAAQLAARLRELGIEDA